MQGKRLFRFGVTEDGRVDVLQILLKARATAVVIDHHLQIIRSLTELLVVLFGAEERAERVVVPDVPTDLNAIVDAFGGPINFAINLILAVGPEFLPCQNFWVVQQQAPEGDEISVARSGAGVGGARKFIQFDQALARPLHADAALAPLSSAVFAEAGKSRAAIESAVARADRIVERPLSLRAPHNAINLVRLDVVLNQRVEEMTDIGVIQTRLASAPAVDVHLRHLLEIGDQSRIVDVLEPAIALHAARFGFGHNSGEQVEIPEVRRAQIFEDRFVVILRM